VDFVLYGERGLWAFVVKRTARLRPADLSGLRAFLRDYPMAKACLIYGGARENHEDGVRVMPMGECLRLLPGLL
jgi:hypothetical protein